MANLSFDWDERKERANQRKHRVSFVEAQTVFFDDDAVQYPDPDHCDDEARFLMVGRSFQLRILLVCHCYRAEESVIRIISARKATAKERGVYLRRKQR